MLSMRTSEDPGAPHLFSHVLHVPGGLASMLHLEAPLDPFFDILAHDNTSILLQQEAKASDCIPASVVWIVRNTPEAEKFAYLMALNPKRQKYDSVHMANTLRSEAGGCNSSRLFTMLPVLRENTRKLCQGPPPTHTHPLHVGFPYPDG